MKALLQQVRRTMLRHRMCPPGSRVLVAVSGGSDSVALTLLLRELAPALKISVAAIAHVNHQLRETAGRDEEFCRKFAARLGVPILVSFAHVKEAADAGRLSIEDAARRLRYESLERAMADVGATRVAVGHTLDDQAETFLLKLARGAGATGLGAIYPSRQQVIRPLLEVTRTELRDYLSALGEQWVEDETNADVSNPRNRLRHDVLPHLETALNLPARRAIARAAGLIGEDALWLDALAAQRLAALSVRTAAGVELDAEGLLAEPIPLLRRILLQALRIGADGKEVGLEHVQQTVDVLTGLCSAGEVPGSRVELRGKKLVLLQ